MKNAEARWEGTVTGRDVEWRPVKVDKREVWVTSDERIEARIPER